MLDIHSKSSWPGKALSNFFPHRFEIDGVTCGSMEGFLQSLKCQNAEIQRRICSLAGIGAKFAGQLQPDWKVSQLLWWQGQAYDKSRGRLSGVTG